MLGGVLGGAWQVQPVVQHDAGAPRAGTYIRFVVPHFDNFPAFEGQSPVMFFHRVLYAKINNSDIPLKT